MSCCERYEFRHDEPDTCLHILLLEECEQVFRPLFKVLVDDFGALWTFGKLAVRQRFPDYGVDVCDETVPFKALSKHLGSDEP